MCQCVNNFFKIFTFIAFIFSPAMPTLAQLMQKMH